MLIGYDLQQHAPMAAFGLGQGFSVDFTLKCVDKWLCGINLTLRNIICHLIAEQVFVVISLYNKAINTCFSRQIVVFNF